MAVLLVDIDDLTNLDQLALLYVGATRAKSVLGLVRSTNAAEMSTANEFGTRIAGMINS